MSKSLTNLLIFAALAFGGYYLWINYLQPAMANASSSSGTSGQSSLGSGLSSLGSGSTSTGGSNDPGDSTQGQTNPTGTEANDPGEDDDLAQSGADDNEDD